MSDDPNEKCFSYEMITSNGLWGKGIRLKDFSLPIFLIYIILALATSSALASLLRRFRQPRVIAEIITGIIWGPTLAGQLLQGWKDPQKNVSFYSQFTAKWRLNLLEIAGHLGIFFFVFLVGVDIDIRQLRTTAVKSLAVAAAITVAPFAVVLTVAFLFKDSVLSVMDINSEADINAYLFLLSLLLSATSLPVVARILTELKLLSTDLGRIAISAAVINDAVCWGFVPVLIDSIYPYLPDDDSDEEEGSTLARRVLIYGALFGSAVLIPAFLAIGRAGVMWIHRRTPEGETVTNRQLGFVLGGAFACAFCTDGLGIHYLAGAFLYGLIIPPGPVATALVEKLDHFVSRILLPLFFAIPGMSINYAAIFSAADYRKAGSLPAVLSLTVLSAAVKIGATLGVTRFFSVPFHEGLSLALLLNCRSLVEIILLDTGETQAVMKQPPFVIIVLLFFLMSAAAAPTVYSLYRPRKLRALTGYKQRNLQHSKPDAELKMVACVHGARNVPSILSLLEISNPTKRSPIIVFVLHLVELTGRGNSTLVAHTPRDNRSGNRSHSDQIISAFENYEQHAGGVSVRPVTNIAPYEGMPGDICDVAGDKRVAVIILPFHLELAVDGGMEVIHPAVQGLNQKVLETAPCSVGILVDRGLSGTARYSGGHHHNVAVLFFSGPDDREALAYAWRMAAHPGITVTVVRFLLGDGAGGRGGGVGALSQPSSMKEDQRVFTMPLFDGERERQLDDEYVNEFRLRFVSDDSVVYLEKVASSSEETVAAIRLIDGGGHDLYVVGRGHGLESQLTAGLTEWSEFPELGAIGDLLASTDFGVTVSVLVMQQYVDGFGSGEVEESMPDSPGWQVKQCLGTANQYKAMSSVVRPAPNLNQGWRRGV